MAPATPFKIASPAGWPSGIPWWATYDRILDPALPCVAVTYDDGTSGQANVFEATLVAGTAVSAAGGAAYGVYQLSKAVVVPVGYELGSGMVLSYETLSQISAHAILAVSDCAYLVLSLEGPRWVLYAVKGNLGRGEDLPTGAILDLKKMQEQGEEVRYLPVSDEEMKKVVESVYGNLPETRAGVDEGSK
jgi:hypothetical protein